MPRRLGSRLLIEAFVIATVAVVLGMLDHHGTVDLSSLQKIVAIFGTWALVVVADWATTRERPAGAAPAEQPPAPAGPLAEVAAGVPGPVVVVSEPEPEPEPEPELESKPAQAPEPEPEPEPEPIVIGVDDSPREWNLWELERLANERQGQDPTRDEEWAFLLLYLRDFANPDGALSVDFDALVRDSFSDLIASARR